MSQYVFPKREVQYSRDQVEPTDSYGKFAVRDDDESGLSVFPNYTGKIQTQLLPVLVDDEEEIMRARLAAEIHSARELMKSNELLGIKTGSATAKPGFGRDMLWMPDKICKVCYHCEDPFTMYRRRHHCRMCGQVFCDRCSSEYVDGSQIPGLGAGLHRACGLCHELYCIQTEKDQKSTRVRSLASAENRTFAEGTLNAEAAKSGNLYGEGNHEFKHDAANKHNSSSSSKPAKSSITGITDEEDDARKKYNGDLHKRASAHLDGIIQNLVNNSILTKDPSTAVEWKSIISSLVNEVVSNVDPDVRGGDSMDIRHYVKLKIIPGGKLEETKYVDGVVFRKNVSHKKMMDNSQAGIIYNPKILVLGGGIEFQRTEERLSTMDTLIEQEDRYISILVDKIMFLKPDLILVGKAVSRRAQELLCNYHVAVVQNIKPELLERISRVTGAITLPSTDHMIQQYGEECLGTCERFLLRPIRDDPEHQVMHSQANRVLKNSVARGSTHVYLDGCPATLGCTIVIRGAARPILEVVKNIVRFSIIAAYHLRLEVAYYNDRDLCLLPVSDGSENDDGNLSEDDGQTIDFELNDDKDNNAAILASKENREMLSTSLDIDIGLPYSKEIRGLQRKGVAYRRNIKKINIGDHQTLLFNNFALNVEQKMPRGKTEVLRIGYYTGEDITLGQFLIENCYHLSAHKQAGRDQGLLDQVLSFTHRAGRINISVTKEHTNESKSLSRSGVNNSDEATSHASSKNSATGEHGANSQNSSGVAGAEGGASTSGKDPFYLPIYMSSYCHECKCYISRNQLMCDETWKMSFGKFMEMTFYNRSARAKIAKCNHNIREDHELQFSCDGYCAKFYFIPVHPYSLHVRNGMLFPEEFHEQHVSNILRELPAQIQELNSRFKQSIRYTRNYVAHFLQSEGIRPSEHGNDIGNAKHLSEYDIAHFTGVSEVINVTLNTIAEEINEFEKIAIEDVNRTMIMLPSAQSLDKAQEELLHIAEVVHSGKRDEDISGSDHVLGPFKVAPKSPKMRGNAQRLSARERSVLQTRFNFPRYHHKQVFVKASDWNITLEKIHVFLDQLSHAKMATRAYQKYNQGDMSRPGTAVEEGSTPSSPDRSASLRTSPVKALAQSTHVEEDKERDEFFLGREGEKKGIAADDECNSFNSKDPSTTAVAGKTNASASVYKSFRDDRGLSKALGRVFFGAGGENHDSFDAVSRITIPLEHTSFGTARLGLVPGRRGEVIPVREDELSTIIAYSLSSTDYYSQLTNFVRKYSARRNDKNVSTRKDWTEPSPEDHKYERKVISEPVSDENAAALDASDEFLKGNCSVPVDDSDNSELLSYGDYLFSQAQNECVLDLDVTEEPERATIDAKVRERIRSINEALLISQKKSHIEHKFDDGHCKFTCVSHWALQFEAIRAGYFRDEDRGVHSSAPASKISSAGAESVPDFDYFDMKPASTGTDEFVQSLALSAPFSTQGGKSGAAFTKSLDGRFVCKVITKTETDMFIDFSQALAYFEYMANAFYRDLPTVLCKILGIYTITFERENMKKITQNVVVMENIFHERNINKIFDLKGSSRARYTELTGARLELFDENLINRRHARKQGTTYASRVTTSEILLDDNLLELTGGRPFPLKHRAKIFFDKAVANDTEFLSVVNVVDYSILVGFDEKSHEIVVGIIDYIRQYDTLKKFESVGKSVGMIAGQAEPTIIAPAQYCKRFNAAMDRYFMAVPDHWSFSEEGNSKSSKKSDVKEN